MASNKAALPNQEGGFFRLQTLLSTPLDNQPLSCYTLNKMKIRPHKSIQAAFLVRYKDAMKSVPTPEKIAPTPTPAPDSLPSVGVGPFEGFATARCIAGIKLAPEMNVYYVLLCDGYFATVRQSGIAMKVSYHFLDLYKYTPHPTKPTRVYTILESKPIMRLLTGPFLFHVKSDALISIKKTLSTLTN